MQHFEIVIDETKDPIGISHQAGILDAYNVFQRREIVLKVAGGSCVQEMAHVEISTRSSLVSAYRMQLFQALRVGGARVQIRPESYKKAKLW